MAYNGEMLSAEAVLSVQKLNLLFSKHTILLPNIDRSTVVVKANDVCYCSNLFKRTVTFLALLHHKHVHWISKSFKNLSWPRSTRLYVWRFYKAKSSACVFIQPKLIILHSIIFLALVNLCNRHVPLRHDLPISNHDANPNRAE